MCSCHNILVFYGGNSEFFLLLDLHEVGMLITVTQSRTLYMSSFNARGVVLVH